MEENLKLVHYVLKRFRDRGAEYDDLYQYGCMGLLKAIDRFDPQYNVRFSTYAVPVILGEIRRLFRESGSIRIGRKIRDLSLKIARIREMYFAQHGEEPTVSMLADMLAVTDEEITQAILAAMPVTSLTVREDDGNALEQLDIPTESFEESLPERISLQQALEGLKEEDQLLIRLRYREDKTQAQTAELLGTAQVQISRREKKILLHLRQQLEV